WRSSGLTGSLWQPAPRHGTWLMTYLSVSNVGGIVLPPVVDVAVVTEPVVMVVPVLEDELVIAPAVAVVPVPVEPVAVPVELEPLVVTALELIEPVVGPPELPPAPAVVV